MTNNTIISEKGLLIKSSYNFKSKRGYYKIFRLADKKLMVKGISRNTNASDNVMSFLGVITALKLTRKLKEAVTLYCPNSTALAWVKKKKCNSKVVDNKLLNAIIAANEYLRCNDFPDVEFSERVPKRLIPIEEIS